MRNYVNSTEQTDVGRKGCSEISSDTEYLSFHKVYIVDFFSETFYSNTTECDRTLMKAIAQTAGNALLSVPMMYSLMKMALLP